MSRRPGLTFYILLALVLGALVGWLWPEVGRQLQVLATIFIRLVMMIIAPLIFSTLVVGIAGSGKLRELGGMVGKAIAFYLLLTVLTMALGFGIGNWLQPGQGIVPTAGDISIAAPEESFWVRLFPKSIVDAMARGDVLQIVVFSLVFALAVGAAGGRGKPVLDFCRSLADVMFKFTDYVMLAAPVGVFGAMAALVAAQGLTVGASFLRLTVATYLGFALIFFGLYPALLVFFRIPVREFWRAVREPLSIAFATTSSAAALPRAMENLERFGVARRVVAFVLPTGTLNLAGSGVFLGIAGLFVLQAFQIPLTLMQQLSLFGTLYVASKGIANIPRGSLVALAAGLGGFGVPPEVVGAAFGFLLAIDPILDMPRTVVNSTGIYVAASLVSRWQGNFRQTLPPA
ncbi:MAG: dicarboxylate/amino acid:cation symporter [Acidobacteria bacterium]|nr:dicarboxylate/amino acid:cation symporter [Acidobacteriota bacterium]